MTGIIQTSRPYFSSGREGGDEVGGSLSAPCMGEGLSRFSCVSVIMKVFCAGIGWVWHANKVVRPDLLVQCFVARAQRVKTFPFSKKKKFDHVIELMHTCTWLCHRLLICGST